jgi:hypothetical protein
LIRHRRGRAQVGRRGIPLVFLAVTTIVIMLSVSPGIASGVAEISAPLGRAVSPALTMMSLNNWLRKTHCGTFREVDPGAGDAAGVPPNPAPLKMRVAPAPDDRSGACT